MIELFEAVERCELGSVNIAVTALEPEYLGEKALISNGQIVWKSSAKVFDGQAVSQLQESGIETVDGCKVFCDTLGQEKHLVVCGGGHVSIPVIKIGIMMGMKVTVLEDRPKFADNARRAGADQVIVNHLQKHSIRFWEVQIRILSL
ncbi:MAG: XdhC family protein [Dorea sp.]